MIFLIDFWFILSCFKRHSNQRFLLNLPHFHLKTSFEAQLSIFQQWNKYNLKLVHWTHQISRATLDLPRLTISWQYFLFLCVQWCYLNVKLAFLSSQVIITSINEANDIRNLRNYSWINTNKISISSFNIERNIKQTLNYDKINYFGQCKCISISK